MDGNLLRFHAIGDPHISKRHIGLSMEAIENTIKYINKNPNVHFIVIMGDILDTHDESKLTLQRIAIDWINRLSEKIHTIVLIGNHDRPSNMDMFSETHPFMGMKDIPGKLTIVNKPKALIIKGEDTKPHTVLFMPYVPPGKFISGFNLFLDQMHKVGKWKSIRGIGDFPLVFAHQEFKGAPYGPVVSTKGDVWPDTYGQIISGHIHTRIRLTNNIYYTGSLYPITTAESNDKGIVTCTYNSSTRKLDTKVVRIVMSQKAIYRIKASDSDAVMEMIALDRENTKYIVQGTSDELASIKHQVSGKKLNIAYDARHAEPSTVSIMDYDTILRSKVKDPVVLALLEEILLV